MGIWIPIVISLVGLLVSIGSLYVVIRQTKVLANSERPWVVPSLDHNAILQAIGTGAQDIPVIVTYRNYGQTPAWITSLGFQIWTGVAGQFRPPFDCTWGTMSRQVLVRDSNSFIQTVGALYLPEYIEVKLGIRAAYVYGYITYKDDGGKSHSTRFCYHYQIARPGSMAVVEAFYSGGPEGYDKYT